METMPKIGQRVKYKTKDRECRGVVMALYPSLGESSDPETGEVWINSDSVGMKVDKPLPTWWPYVGEDRFAPDISEIEILIDEIEK